MWLAISLALTWYAVMILFVAAMHAKVIARESRLTLFWKIHLYPMAALGILLDAVFNLTFGLVMFAELPREFLFSTKVERHFRTSEDWRHKLALFWAKQLNRIDPGHIRVH
jgi:hypothetical protein